VYVNQETVSVLTFRTMMAIPVIPSTSASFLTFIRGKTERRIDSTLDRFKSVKQASATMRTAIIVMTRFMTGFRGPFLIKKMNLMGKHV